MTPTRFLRKIILAVWAVDGFCSFLWRWGRKCKSKNIGAVDHYRIEGSLGPRNMNLYEFHTDWWLYSFTFNHRDDDPQWRQCLQQLTEPASCVICLVGFTDDFQPYLGSFGVIFFRRVRTMSWSYWILLAHDAEAASLQVELAALLQDLFSQGRPFIWRALSGGRISNGRGIAWFNDIIYTYI